MATETLKRVRTSSLSPASSHEDRTALLSACSLFRGVSLNEYIAIRALFRVRSVPRGGFYFEQGGTTPNFYVLTTGAVKLTRVDRDGHQITLRLVTCLEPFGAVAALSGHVSHSAQALTDTETLMLDAPTLVHVIDSYPRVAQNAARLLAGWVADSWERLDDLGSRAVDQRVARGVLRCIATTHSSARTERSITLALSHRELADVVGASVFTVSRVLSAWKRLGIVDVKRGRLVVQRPEDLAATAGSEMTGRANEASAG